MNQLQKDLQSVLKGLNSLAKQTERIAKKLDKLEKSPVSKKPKATARRARAKKTAIVKTAKKPSAKTATDQILDLISRSKKGVDTAVLTKKTGFNDKKIWNIINRLKKLEKIKSERKGVYLKV
jgi:hypothetical protein